MHVLLVNPQYPESYWSGKCSLPYLGSKVLLPPLSLITVAGLLPDRWTYRLVDLNGESLLDEDIRWADVVMLTGMIVQKPSLHNILNRCKQLAVPTVVGGPYATALPDHLADATHIVIGEMEHLASTLAEDLAMGKGQPIYREEKKPSLVLSPTPRFDLLKPNLYYQMAIQFSRGCPFNCEFCDIIVLYGRKPRTKTCEQIINELEAIRTTGFSGDIFFVDDNFVGNKRAVKDLLPDITAWRRETRAPFAFYTQASMDIADEPGLVASMVQAGFTKVFIGIETPSEDALRETRKAQNLKRNMVEQIHWLLEQGLDVAGGFILGFDSDGPDIFERLTRFIDEAAIPFAMVGLLGALPNTALYKRLKREGRLTPEICGDQFGMTNVVTKMPVITLLKGYRQVNHHLYTPEKYFLRCRMNIARLAPPAVSKRLQGNDLIIAIRLLWGQGFRSSYRPQYWKFLGWTLRHYPSKISVALREAAAGHHFISYTRNIVIPSLNKKLLEVSTRKSEKIKAINSLT